MKPSRKSRTTLALAVVGTLTLAISAAALRSQEAAPAGASADNGQAVYRSAGCQRCHGPNGQDGTEGPPLAPDPIPYEEFGKIVRDGKGGGMPAFDATKVKESDLADIYAFLKAVAQ